MIADNTFYKDHQFTEQPVEVYQDFNCQGIHDTVFVPKDRKRQRIKYFTFLRSSNIDIDGKATDHRYGFKIDGEGTGFPIKFEGESRNISMNNVEITGGTHAAFPAKNEGINNMGSTLPIDYIRLVDAWIHNNKGEGLYWMTSKTFATLPDGSQVPVGRCRSAEVINVTIEDSGWDALQVKHTVNLLVMNCLFKNFGIEEHKNQKYAMMMSHVEVGLIRNSIFDTGPDIAHLQKGIGRIVFENCLCINWGAGFYNDEGIVVFKRVYLKNLGTRGFNALMRGKFEFHECKVDIGLKDKLASSGVEILVNDIEFVELPDVEYDTKPWGETYVKPGSFYHQLGMGVDFDVLEVPEDKHPEQEQPPVEEPTPAGVSIEEAKKAWVDYNQAYAKLNAFFEQV